FVAAPEMLTLLRDLYYDMEERTAMASKKQILSDGIPARVGKVSGSWGKAIGALLSKYSLHEPVGGGVKVGDSDIRNVEHSGVRAWVYRDDHAIECEFDAAPWLEQASIDEIVDLAKCGWGGDNAADTVAEESEELLKGTDQGDTLSALFTFTSPKEGE